LDVCLPAAVAGGRRQLRGPRQQVGGGRIDEGGGDQKDRLVAGSGPVDDADPRRRIPADELTDQPVGIGLCHADSVEDRAAATLTLG